MMYRGVDIKCPECKSTNITLYRVSEGATLNTSARQKHNNTEFVRSYEYDYYWLWKANKDHHGIECKECCTRTRVAIINFKELSE